MNRQVNHVLITIDVEDWFQVENFRQYIPFSSWPSCELRAEKNTYHLLDLLDSFTGSRTNDRSRGGKVRGTFFVLGWIAERLPHLVREIHSRGHEVASHGYQHRLCGECSFQDFKTDLIESKKRLEDIIAAPIYGYRAPSFSINDGILKLIEECGYLYDSSFNSFGMHGRYGQVDLSRAAKNGIAAKISDGFYELPISNINLGNHILPWGGAGYFRLIPFSLFKLGVRSILRKENGYMFYLHPWEIDPEQPKVKESNIFFKFRHYANLNKTLIKLAALIEAFKCCRFVTCREYLNEHKHV
jgi:polysaccharide deacetylase family protein (PEP-CTERM system associated)